MQLQILSIRDSASDEAAQKILAGYDDIFELKKLVCEKYGIAGGLKNTEILARIPSH